MARSLAISAVLASMLIGCSSITPSVSQQPTASPTLGITTPLPTISVTPGTAATAPATARPTSVATLAPTVAASATATGESTTSPVPSGTIVHFGATTFVFADDLSDPTSGWGTGTTSGGTVGYVDGTLRFETDAQGSKIWSWTRLDQNWNVVRIEAVMVPSAAGTFGLLCAASDGDLFGAAVTTAGNWFFIRVTDAGASALTPVGYAGWNVPTGLSTAIALDCAGTATGSMRMQLTLTDLGVAAFYEATEGADTFDRVGVYVESSVHPFSLGLDNVVVYGGPEPGGQTWDADATEHQGQVGERFAYHCSPGGSESPIYGTDVYTDDSGVCTAAVHAGLITFAAGGDVVIEMRPGQDSYLGSERNGVTSSNWGSWDSSFVFVSP